MKIEDTREYKETSKKINKYHKLYEQEVVKIKKLKIASNVFEGCVNKINKDIKLRKYDRQSQPYIIYLVKLGFKLGLPEVYIASKLNLSKYRISMIIKNIVKDKIDRQYKDKIKEIEEKYIKIL